MECTPTVAVLLDGIERQLTEAAELLLTGGVSEALHAAALHGALLFLPKPLTPGHIQVIHRLKRWKELELIPSALYAQLQSDIMTRSRSSAVSGESSYSRESSYSPASAALAPSTSHAKQQKLGAGQLTIFKMLPDATRTRVPSQELKRQREAALRGEDYEVEWQHMRRFRKEITTCHEAVSVQQVRAGV